MRTLLRQWLQLVSLPAALLVVQCGRSDPLACRNDCDEEGEKRCQESVVEVCVRAVYGCLNWTDAVDCAEGGGICADASGEVRCLYPCQDGCSPEHATRCSGTAVHVCETGSRGCLGWFFREDCASVGQVCDDSSGEAVCVCRHECAAEGESRCGGAVVQKCTRLQNGCLAWQEEADCAGRECGPDPRCGESCGECAGQTEICNEGSGQCIDLCAGKECGPSGGFDCGSCPEGEVCVENACFAPHCEDGMCYVPAGRFWMGCNEEVDFMCRPDEFPYHPVYLSGFWIDQYEVTQAEYLACYLAGRCGNTPPCYFDPETHPEIPVVCMGIQGAQSYCEFMGKRVCTEAEWEKAARGTDGRRYPWGNQPATCELAVLYDGSPSCGTGSYLAVGSKPAGTSPFGLLDMAGNAAEVVQDYYSGTYYQECSAGCTDPLGPPRPPDSSPLRVVRGGYFESWPQQVRVSSRNYTNDGLGYWIGFRCCK